MKSQFRADVELMVNTGVLLLMIIFIPGVRPLVLSMISVFIIPVMCIEIFDYLKGRHGLH